MIFNKTKWFSHHKLYKLKKYIWQVYTQIKIFTPMTAPPKRNSCYSEKKNKTNKQKKASEFFFSSQKMIKMNSTQF